MKANNRIQSARGFSLLEVLIAVAIFTFGLLALASLQLTLIRAVGSAKAQTTASALAKEKIEQLRDYQNMTEYRTDVVSLANEAINDSSGSLGGVDFVRNTTVSRFVYNKATNAFEAVGSTLTDAQIKAANANYVIGKDFKRVAVTVSWKNASGESNVVGLEDIIDSLDPVETASIAKPPKSASSARKLQKKIFDPAGDPMVIPMALGDGVNTAATNPKPTIVKSGNTVETRFDVLTYGGLSGGTATVQAKVETVMVGCTCDIDEKPGSTVRGMRPTYWDGTSYTIPNDVAAYSPPAAADTQSAAVQSSRCNICCRDHHDPTGVTGATYSPRRVTKVNGIVTVAHTHHYDKATTAAAETGTYKEACRIIRSGGVFAVATDLSNDYYGYVATGDGSTAATYVPDSTSSLGSPPIPKGATARYQKFVLDYMASRFATANPSPGTEQDTYNTVGTPTTLAESTTYELDLPSSIAIAATDNTGKWLHARGLYVDYLEEEAVTAITSAKAETACNTADPTATPPKTAADVLKQCVLRRLPFTSINLTELADWAPTTFPLKVSNSSYDTSSGSVAPVRGNVTSSSANGDLTATSSMRSSNSGLLDLFFDSISPTDNVPLTKTQAFTAGSGPPTPPSPTSWTVLLTMPTNFSGSVTVKYQSNASGGLSGPCSPDTSTANLYDFTCDAGSVGLGSAYGMSVVVATYNTSVPTDSTAALSCTYALGTSGFPTKSHTPSGPYSTNVCKDYVISSAVNQTQSNTAAYSIVVDSATSTKVAEFTTVTYQQVAAGDTVTAVFGSAPVSSTTLIPTCTYTCPQGEQGFDCKANKYAYSLGVAPVCP
jgi:type IV pilus modification protein PilV